MLKYGEYLHPVFGQRRYWDYMKKFKIIAATAALVFVLSGCSLVDIDQEKVQNQVVATVNGTEIYRYQVDKYINYSLQYYMAYYDMEMDDILSDEDSYAWYKELKTGALDTLVLNEVFRQKAPELGIALTEEEKQEKREQSDDYFKSQKEYIRTEVESELGITDENADGEPADTGDGTEEDTDTVTDGASNTDGSDEAATDEPADTSDDTEEDANVEEIGDTGNEDANVDESVIEGMVEERYAEYIEEFGYDPDTYYEYLCDQALISKVEEYINGLAEVTDQEARDWYDQTLALQQQQMDEDASVFADTVYDNQIYTYVPADTVAVKQIFMAYENEELAGEAQTLYTEGDVDGAFDLLKDEIDKLMPTALEIQQKLQDGEDINTLIEEYNEDPGMTSEPNSKYGYLVEARTEGYVDEFKEAALKLTDIGDVSDPVVTYMGVHILKCIEIYKQRIVPYDELYEKIKTALLPNQQQQVYDETTGKWLDEFDITYDTGRLFNGE